MITLYGVHRSRASRALWLLNELELPFVHVPVIQSGRLEYPHGNGAPLNTAKPEFLALNPLGQVPLIDDDGLILAESLAITLHIARGYGGALGPQSDAETALMEQWTLFAATSIERSAREILNVVESGGAETPQGRSLIALSVGNLRRPLTHLQVVLDAHPYLVSDRFTMADINLAECLRYAQEYPPVIAEFAVVEAWLVRCQSRPAFKVMWQKHHTESD